MMTDETLLRNAKRLSVHRSPYRGVVYRSSTPQFSKAGDILSGSGSARFGGRFNPAGLSAVYASETPETAISETLAHFRYYGFDIASAMPRLFTAIDVALQLVLDLTDSAIRRKLGISRALLLECDWRRWSPGTELPASQRLGYAAFLAGFEAVLATSAVALNGRNLVVFPQNRLKGSAIAIRS